MWQAITHEQYWKDYSSYYIMEKEGFGMIRVTQEGSNFELSDLYVEEDHRKQGIATYLIRDAINACKEHAIHGTIKIYTNYNSDAWVGQWYENLGFKYVGLVAPMSTIIDNSIEWSNLYELKF